VANGQDREALFERGADPGAERISADTEGYDGLHEFVEGEAADRGPDCAHRPRLPDRVCDGLVADQATERDPQQRLPHLDLEVGAAQQER
jgi:hypothetical protein